MKNCKFKNRYFFLGWPPYDPETKCRKYHHTRLSAKPGDMAAAAAVATERVCLRVMVQACSEKVADSQEPTGRVQTRAS